MYQLFEKLGKEKYRRRRRVLKKSECFLFYQNNKLERLLVSESAIEVQRAQPQLSSRAAAYGAQASPRPTDKNTNGKNHLTTSVEDNTNPPLSDWI